MTFKRKLASVMYVEEVLPIPNADKLELARLDGWKAVVQKDKFKVGDRVVYVETDSLLPPWEEFSFMAERKYRVKQIRLRGQLSDGLVFHFDDIQTKNIPFRMREAGTDLTELLEIKHYQKEAEAAKAGKNPQIKQRGVKGRIYSKAIKTIENLIGPINGMGPWPGYCPKSDEPTLRHVWGIVKNNYLGLPVVCHEKMHGKSLTLYYHQGKVGVCSRNYELLTDASRPTSALRRKVATGVAKLLGIRVNNYDQEDYWIFANRIKDSVVAYCELTGQNLAIQLELCGPKINGNMYQFPDYRGFVFNVWDIDERRYFNTDEVSSFCSRAGLERVPELKLMQLHDDLEQYFVDATGNSLVATSIREGMVVRPLHTEIHDPAMGRFSFKVVSPDYKAREDKLLGLE